MHQNTPNNSSKTHFGLLGLPGGPRGGQKVIWWCKKIFLAESIWSFRQNTLYLSQVSGLGGHEPWFWLCPFTIPPTFRSTPSVTMPPPPSLEESRVNLDQKSHPTVFSRPNKIITNIVTISAHLRSMTVVLLWCRHCRVVCSGWAKPNLVVSSHVFIYWSSVSSEPSYQ